MNTPSPTPISPAQPSTLVPDAQRSRPDPETVEAFTLVRTSFDTNAQPLVLVLSQTFACTLADLIRDTAPSSHAGGASLRALQLQIHALLRSRNLI